MAIESSNDAGDSELRHAPARGSSYQSHPSYQSHRPGDGEDANIPGASSSSSSLPTASPAPSSRAVPMPRFFATYLTGPAGVVPIEDSDSSMPATGQTSRLGPRQSEDVSMPMSTAPSDEQTVQNSGSQTGSQAYSTMYGTSALANATTATTNSNSSGSDFDIPGVSQISSEESKESEPPPAPLQVFNSLEQHQNGTCKPCRFFQLKETGCRLGDTCRFCHFCSREQAKSDRLRVKYEVRRNKRLRSLHGQAEVAFSHSTSGEE